MYTTFRQSPRRHSLTVIFFRQAPIIPHVASVDDTRNFSHLPLPPADEIPGLIREESPPSLRQRFDSVAYQFLEF